MCGFVGTDIEFQSRKAADGTVHDYAFVGTMGAGTRIFDVTDPAHPVAAGRYTDPGYQNDVQVSGRHARARLRLALAERRDLGLPANQGKRHGRADARPASTSSGSSTTRETATFETQLVDCYLSSVASAGAHTTTIHPSGDYLTVNTSFNGLEVVDIRSAPATLVRYDPGRRRRRRARRLVLARRQHALQRRARLDARSST